MRPRSPQPQVPHPCPTFRPRARHGICRRLFRCSNVRTRPTPLGALGGPRRHRVARGRRRRRAGTGSPRPGLHVHRRAQPQPDTVRAPLPAPPARPGSLVVRRARNRVGGSRFAGSSPAPFRVPIGPALHDRVTPVAPADDDCTFFRFVHYAFTYCSPKGYDRGVADRAVWRLLVKIVGVLEVGGLTLIVLALMARAGRKQGGTS
jgi:hypothetical protein